MPSSITSDTQSHRDSRFACNICLEPVLEPVVTLCGHLYCWPCLYRWLEPGITSDEYSRLWGTDVSSHHHHRHNTTNSGTSYRVAEEARTRRTCPVCKASCSSISTIVPIYEHATDAVGDVRRLSRFRTVPPRPAYMIPSTSIIDHGNSRNGHEASSPRVSSSSQDANASSSLSAVVFSFQQALFWRAPDQVHHTGDPATDFLSRVLLILGSFVILCLLLF